MEQKYVEENWPENDFQIRFAPCKPMHLHMHTYTGHNLLAKLTLTSIKMD